ncbi:MAG TPA: type IV pilus modification protein PilV [Steroidobacteraceae bacterium]|nr:type IV pilus modification protein PilV [Steroidobacteraceae bacterium]
MRKMVGTDSPGTHRGFTLVETMVALVVLSIGLLGVAKLVTGAVHANDSGYMRGQATQLAYEILDQMRANRPGAAAGFYTGAGTLKDCTAAACNDQDLAGLDMYNWRARLKATLPNGTGAVNATQGVGGTVAVIVVQWDDSEAQWAFGTPATTATPSPMTVQLTSVL